MDTTGTTLPGVVIVSDEPVRLQELRTPLQLVNRMEWVMHYAKKATQAIGDPEDGLKARYLAAKMSYMKARLAHMAENPKGTKTDREDAAQLANWDLFQTMNLAELELTYARDKQSDLERELSKLQSESRLIIKELELAGRGSI